MAEQAASQPSDSTTVPGAVTSASSTMSGVMAPAPSVGISSNRAPNSFIPTPLIIPHSGVQPSPPIAPAPLMTPYSGVHMMLGQVGQGHPQTVTAFPSINSLLLALLPL
ncbi:uncharacterized protein C8R40DRAFT_1177033 [Lentinula edodes]|uniref:uncharacterized protein n=1 Tax=Lentinula edodes TaxID=5353 RepID=UPI001E8EDFF8|nr:uncharacterized protein C8R40DRAFT_1177033 [Lentinula edodes]KAH7869220.1 hypothetical protein C8R40DRAFT_1177033 [Lentinula edodes]